MHPNDSETDNHKNKQTLFGMQDGNQLAFVHKLDTKIHIQTTTHSLGKYSPKDSNHHPMPKHVITSILLIITLTILGAIIYPYIFNTITILLLLAVIIFHLTNLLTFCFIRNMSHQSTYSLTNEELPKYTILLPLLHEENMIHQLTKALENLDYPRNKLEIFYLVEQSDNTTKTFVQNHLVNSCLPAKLIIVPEGHPKTKPRACNYGLWHASGELCVIYDAEDIPHPQQLREAANKFHSLPDTYACLQAPLDIKTTTSYNIFSTYMMIDYLYLFHMNIPTMDYFKLPILLGGTSNHLRVDALRSIYGWDSWNVAEDADLGIRLATKSYKTGILKHSTIESSTDTFVGFIKQRTRWLKGFLQTWLVRNRDLRTLLKTTGIIGFTSFQITMVIRCLSGITHCYFLYTFIFSNSFITNPWTLKLIFSIYGLIFFSYMIICIQKKAYFSMIHIIFIPLVWLLYSIIFSRAIWQLVFSPFKWEKTPHSPLKP